MEGGSGHLYPKLSRGRARAEVPMSPSWAGAALAMGQVGEGKAHCGCSLGGQRSCSYPVCLEPRESARLIPRHQAGVADQVSRENGGKPPFHSTSNAQRPSLPARMAQIHGRIREINQSRMVYQG